MAYILLAVIFVLMALLLSSSKAYGCTGVYIGKKVSADGSVIVARSEDVRRGVCHKKFMVRARVTEPGRYYIDEGKGQKGFKIPLPETTYKYTYVPNSLDYGDGEYPACSMNEYGLTVIATVTAAASDTYRSLDPYVIPGIREAILSGILACQCKTAREASLKLAELLDEYGSGEGNIIFLTDQEEGWIFECYGGHTYAAMKMPEDKVAVFGNNFMIETVDRDDRENYIFSKNLFETIDKVGAVKEDGRYNIAKSISVRPRTEYANMRTWRGHGILAPSTSERYDDEIFYPLFYAPDEKVSVEKVMDIYRDRYEGTEYDMTKPENDARRPIGINRTAEVHIVQVFPSLPPDTCNLQWLAMGNAEHSVFIPAFSGITETYKAYHVDGNKYDPKGMYSAFKRICAIAENDREFLGESPRDFWKLQEKMMIKDMREELPKVKKAYEEGLEAGRKYVTDLAEKYAEKQFKNSKTLFNDLFWHAMRNMSDKSHALPKEKFTARTKLGEIAEAMGYAVSKTGPKEYTAEKGDEKYVLKAGNKICKAVKDGTESKVELTLAPRLKSRELYVPVDFAKTL